MLKHFQAGDYVVGLRALLGDRLGGDGSILNFPAGFEQVQFGDLECLVGKVDTSDLGAFGRHGLGQYAATTADIDNRFASKGSQAVDPLQT